MVLLLGYLFLQKGFVSKWLDDLWQQQWEGGFWAAGNWIMDVAVMLDATWRHFKNTDAFNAIHELLDALDRRQCSRTGYWFGPHDTNREAMAGAMHIYPVYWAYNRQINHLSDAVDNTIQLQQSDGLFDYSIGSGGSQCLDYDAVLVLANGLVLCPEYRQQIRSACSRVLDAIMVNHQPDGSFSDSLQETQRHWATRAAVYFANKGSLWDTYARLMTVAICLEIVTGVPTTNARFEHHWFELFHGGRGWKDGFFQTD